MVVVSTLVLNIKRDAEDITMHDSPTTLVVSVVLLVAVLLAPRYETMLTTYLRPILCTFRFQAVIFSEGELYLDDCDFSGSTSSTLVYSEPGSTAVMRNAVLGENNCEPQRVQPLSVFMYVCLLELAGGVVDYSLSAKIPVSSYYNRHFCSVLAASLANPQHPFSILCFTGMLTVVRRRGFL